MEHLNGLFDFRKMLGLFASDCARREFEMRIGDCAGRSCGSEDSEHPVRLLRSSLWSDSWRGVNVLASCTASSFSALGSGCFPARQGSAPPSHSGSSCSVDSSYSRPGRPPNCL